MIWKRALACQMAPAKFDAVSVDLAVGSEANLFRATGQTLVFPGFMAVYMEGVDDSEEEDESKLPALEVGEVLDVLKVWGDQHFTEPPPRYSEASLVKTLEEYGIGRPSTYASIISTLQDREYVILDSKRFKPTDVGRVVNKFLTEHFTKYVDYDFTANLENELDEIADGAREWIPVLDEFWQGFNQQLLDKAGIDRADISHEDIGEPCPKCGKPLISRLGRYGKFISCSAHPECKYARNIDGGSSPAGEPVSVGTDPASGKNIQLLNGPYGPYLQLGEQEEGSKRKPKRVSIPKDIPAADVNLELALKLISLPREIGLHPDTNKKIIAGIGPFGPYLNNDGTFKSIPKSDSIFDIDLPRAVELLAQAKAKAAPLRELGEHPQEGGSVAIYSGRYGPYVQHGKINATLPKDAELDAVTMEQALELLAAKAAKGAPAKKKPAARKAAAGRKK
jgi:DNA topoisomerase-1